VTIVRQFPKSRLRRLRQKQFLPLFSEQQIHSQQLIYPLFVHAGNSNIALDLLPDLYCFSLNGLLKEIAEAVQYGIQSFAIFPRIDSSLKDVIGSEAVNSDNLMSQVAKQVKQQFPEVTLIGDVALDCYTISGHDGIVVNDVVDNDATVKQLGKQALILAQAGFDAVAPSDMMDGRVDAIRKHLDYNQYQNTVIVSYAAKFHSQMYQPFRSAVASNTPKQSIDKSSYQIHPANRLDAMQSVIQNINEGADAIIVKPSMYYTDIIWQTKQLDTVPIIAYQVSAEYAMLYQYAKTANLALNNVVLESIVALKRAGANAIVTYFAKIFAKHLTGLQK